MKAIPYNLYCIVFLVIRLIVLTGRTLFLIGKIILASTKMKSWTEDTLYSKWKEVDFEIIGGEL